MLPQGAGPVYIDAKVTKFDDAVMIKMVLIMVEADINLPIVSVIIPQGYKENKSG